MKLQENDKPVSEKPITTMLVFVLVFIVVFFVTRSTYALYLSVIFGCVGLFFPSLSRSVHMVWMRFAQGLGFIMNRVILSLVFFLLLVPIALLSKLFRKNPLRSVSSKKDSYFVERNFTYTAKSMENPW